MLVLAFVAGTLIHCLGDYWLKKASIQFTWVNFLLAAASYVVTVPIWWWILKQGKLAVMSSIGSAIQLFILTAIGIVFFREHLTIREICGICLAALALLMFCK